jgi:hypothetical protein
MKNKKTIGICILTIVAAVGIPFMVSLLSGDTEDANAWGGKGRLSDRMFAMRVAGQFISSGPVALPDGTVFTRVYLQSIVEDGTYNHEDSGAFNTDEFFSLMGVDLAAKGIDASGMASTGIGSWKRTGRRKLAGTTYKMKYSSTGAGVLLLENRWIYEYNEDFSVILSTEFSLAYYNLIDLPAPYSDDIIPGLTLDEVNALSDPDPANRPTPWWCIKGVIPNPESDPLRRISVDNVIPDCP